MLLKFKILSKDKKSQARTGIISTAYGKIETPYLVPVATRGSIIALSKKDIKSLKLQAILSNTYHLHFMPPGDKKIKSLGGLHKTMPFNKPIFTDSGGFQALSLGVGKLKNIKKIGFFPNKNKIITSPEEKNFAEIKNEGVLFTSIYNKTRASNSVNPILKKEKKELITPKKSMQIQSNLGSDIIMAFDVCNCAGDSKKETQDAMLLSHQWELESLKYKNPKQALYGIIHGGAYKSLRKQSTKFILSKPFDGIAIGGSLGKSKKEMYKLLKYILKKIIKYKDKRPIHLLGIGHIDDIFHAVSLGVDTFDCVEMTRIARHGNLYISPNSSGNKKNKFKIEIRKSIYKNDNSPIDKTCPCPVCKNFSRSKLRKLYKSKSKEYYKLATIHNISFMENLTKQIRESIKNGNFQELKKHWLR